MTDEADKKADVWMPVWIGSYTADTMELTTIQHGAYFLLLMAYWRRRGPLPDNDDSLRSITKMERAEWKRNRPVLAALFRVGDGVWWHKRVELEMKAAEERKAAAVEKAVKGAKARWGKSTGKPSSDAPSMPQALPGDMPNQCPPPSPYSEPIGSAGADAPASVDKSEVQEAEGRALWKRAGEWLVSNEVETGAAKAFMNSLTAQFGTEVATEALREAIKTAAPYDAKAFATGIAKTLLETRARPAESKSAITVPSTAVEATQAHLAEQAAHVPKPPPAAAAEALQALRKRLDKTSNHQAANEPSVTEGEAA